jgi:hypothetical protein
MGMTSGSWRKRIARGTERPNHSRRPTRRDVTPLCCPREATSPSRSSSTTPAHGLFTATSRGTPARACRSSSSRVRSPSPWTVPTRRSSTTPACRGRTGRLAHRGRRMIRVFKRLGIQMVLCHKAECVDGSSGLPGRPFIHCTYCSAWILGMCFLIRLRRSTHFPF